jgi:hypothetical protein
MTSIDQIQNSHLGTGQVLHGNSRRPWLCAQRPAKPVYSEIIVTLAVEPQAAVRKDQDDTGRNGLTVDMG